MEIKKATRESFAEALVNLGKTNSNVIVLDADLALSTKTILFKKEFPDRFFDCGISECNMIGVAAGLATCGKIPFVASFAIFTAARAFEQIRNTVAYSNLNVKIVGSHSGLSAGKDGATHQSFEDLALMRTVPNMVVVNPCDHYEMLAAVKQIAAIDGPVYLRTSKLSTNLVNDVSILEKFEIGKAVVLKPGFDITLIATGTIVNNVLKAAYMLKQSGIDAGVLNFHTIKPIDEQLIFKAATKTKLIITIEEHSVIGGLGEAVASFVCGLHTDCVVKMIGLNDEFGQSGDEKQLLQHYGFDDFGIYSKIKNYIKQVLKTEV